MTEISDPTFDISKTIYYTLSIRFVPNGFCFVVTDKEHAVLYFTIQKDLAIAHNKYLANQFNQVFFCCDTHQYTLLPKPLYMTDKKEDYWNLNFDNKASEETILTDEVRMTDIINMYYMDKTLPAINELMNVYPNLCFVHRQTIQMSMSVMKNRQGNQQQLHLFLQQDAIDVVYTSEGRVILANTYAYKKEDEFLYYVLNVFDQLKLNQYQTEVLIYGSNKEKIKDLLSDYIKVITIENSVFENINERFHSEEINGQYTLLYLPLAIK